jgi:hypothetical protein
MWPARHRAEVLSALALVAQTGDPLAEGLARLAADDPLLRPWSDRLHDDLRSGRPLGAVLRGHRLIGTGPAHDLDAAIAAGRGAGALARLACDQRAGLPGSLLITWFPAWAAICLVTTLVVMGRALYGLMGLEEMYKQLNVSLPALTQLAIDLSNLHPAWWLFACALLVAVWWLISQVAVLRLVHLVWFTEAQRCLLTARLLDDLHAGRGSRPWSPGRFVRWLASTRCLARRAGEPLWRADWRQWLVLIWLRLPAGRWRALRALRHDPHLAQDLRAHLAAVGLLDGGAVDDLGHVVAEAAAEARHALAQARGQAGFALIMIGLFAVGILTFAAVLPLVGMLSFLGM